MSSLYKVPLTTITEINPHNGADRLEIAKVYGFDVVVRKDSMKVGDEVLYIPIDSILPSELEYHLFPEGSKIKLSKNRVRQIRIRKIASQGMLISKEQVKAVYNFVPDKVEEDYAEKLRITKYEPPLPKHQIVNGVKKRRPLENVNFHKYNGLTNIKWSPLMFSNEIVVFQEKVHGSNARAALLPFQPHTLWEKVKAFFNRNPKFEFCYGSNNVQLQKRKGWTGFYDENIYGNVFNKIEAEKKLKPNETIFGEVYGAGIQSNYDYGLKSGHDFVLFDVKVLEEDGTQRWLNPDEVKAFAEERGFEMVPELYRGPFVDVDHCKAFTLGDSVFRPQQKVREGIVVKSLSNYSGEDGTKRALKVISEKYLDKEQSDFH